MEAGVIDCGWPPTRFAEQVEDIDDPCEASGASQPKRPVFRTDGGFPRKIFDRLYSVNRFASHDNQQRTEPGTEQNLALESDAHPFDMSRSYLPSSVLVDSICGWPPLARRTYSTRIKVWLSEEHPELGRTFSTKYFRIEEPGRVDWGHQGQSFAIQKILQ